MKRAPRRDQKEIIEKSPPEGPKRYNWKEPLGGTNKDQKEMICPHVFMCLTHKSNNTQQHTQNNNTTTNQFKTNTQLTTTTNTSATTPATPTTNTKQPQPWRMLAHIGFHSAG
jgi:hypothetical protein